MTIQGSPWNARMILDSPRRLTELLYGNPGLSQDCQGYYDMEQVVVGQNMVSYISLGLDKCN